MRVLAACALHMNRGFEVRVVGSRANVTFVRGAKPMEGGKRYNPLVEEMSGRRKELESKWGGHEKEKAHPKLLKEAVETLLTEQGVAKLMEKVGTAVVQPRRAGRDKSNPIPQQ